MAKAKGKISNVPMKMANHLRKGAPVDRNTIWGCLYDSEGHLQNIHPHLTLLRDHLKPGYEIICQTIGYKVFYRIIKCLEGEDPFL